MKSSLDYRNDFLCVVAEYEGPKGSLIREWYPVYKAERAELATRHCLPDSLEQIPDRAAHVFAQLGNVSQINATRAIVIELGEHVTADTRSPGNVDDANAFLAHHM